MSNLQDNGRPGSLRSAVDQALPKSVITFDASLHGTILLTSGDLNIAKDLTIRGPGASILSISGGKSGHFVRVIKGTSVNISGLTFKDSYTSNFSSFIGNDGALTLSNCIVSGNTVTNSYQGAGGGGILNAGTLTLNNSTVSGNTVAGNGGGIYYSYGSQYALAKITNITNSTISDNKASSDGGGIFIQSFVDAGGGYPIVHVDLTFSTIYGNTAHSGGDIAIEDVASSSHKGYSRAIKQISQVKIRNSIVADDPAHPGPDIVGMLTSYGFNLFQDTSGASFDSATCTQPGTDKTLSVNDLTR